MFQFFSKVLHHPFFLPSILFIIFTSIFSASTVGVMNSLDGAQYALTQALVEQKTIKIDSYMKYTYYTDYVSFNNHYYSDRDPGLSFLAIPFYYAAKILTPVAKLPYDGQHLNVIEDSSTQAITYLTTAVLGGIGVSLVFILCKLLNRSLIASLVTAVSAGLGTLFWKYSAMFYREPAFITFYLLTFILLLLSSKIKYKNYLAKLFFLSGFIAGISLFIDYSKPYIIFFLYLYILLTQHKKLKLTVLFFTLGLVIALLFPLTYNYQIFKNPLANPHQHNQTLKWTGSFSNNFQTPLIPSMIANLFNKMPLSEDLFPFLWQNEEIANRVGAEWATVWQYKGIFVQTPLLFLALIGWYRFFRNHFKQAVVLFLTAVSILTINSKLTLFWTINSYDSRYFLPTAIILVMGLPFFIDDVKYTKLRFMQLYKYALLIILISMSIYNGWYSNLTSFGPQVSGEHRFSMDQLLQPYYAPQYLKYNFWLLLSNTFPNMYNLHLIFPFYFLPILVFFEIKRVFTYLLSNHSISLSAFIKLLLV